MRKKHYSVHYAMLRYENSANTVEVVINAWMDLIITAGGSIIAWGEKTT